MGCCTSKIRLRFDSEPMEASLSWQQKASPHGKPLLRRAATDVCEISPASHDELILCVQLCCLAYTDDTPGSLEQLSGPKEAIVAITGSIEAASVPLTCIMADMGFTVDLLISHTHLRRSVVDTQGFIAHNDGDIVLSYRGTTNLMDLMTNLRYEKVPFRPFRRQNIRKTVRQRMNALVQFTTNLGHVHKGFYQAFLCTVGDIEEKLIPLLRAKEPKRLILTGHSLGGALATCALAYLLLTFDFLASPHRLLFLTIGQPRVGDLQFREWLWREIRRLQCKGQCTAIRLVHECDGVPHLPPGGMGFAHATPQFHLSKSGELSVDQEFKMEVEKFIDYYEDHGCNSYLARLARQRCRRGDSGEFQFITDELSFEEEEHGVDTFGDVKGNGNTSRLTSRGRTVKPATRLCACWEAVPFCSAVPTPSSRAVV